MKKDKDALQDELQELSPWLHDLKKQQPQGNDGFHLPAGYFEGLEQSVLARLDAAGERRPAPLTAEKGSLLRRLFAPSVLLAAAAAVALALAAVWFFRDQPMNPAAAPQAVAAPDLTEEEIETYVLANIRDFDTDQLAALPPGEATAASALEDHPTTQSKTPSLDDLTSEDVEDILKDMSEEELENLL